LEFRDGIPVQRLFAWQDPPSRRELVGHADDFVVERSRVGGGGVHCLQTMPLSWKLKPHHIAIPSDKYDLLQRRRYRSRSGFIKAFSMPPVMEAR
jgi:hypothetical protein